MQPTTTLFPPPLAVSDPLRFSGTLGNARTQVPHVQKCSLESQEVVVAVVAAPVYVLDVHVHVVAAIEGAGADVADEDARHGGVHRPAMPRQVGVFRELGRALVATVEAPLSSAGPHWIPAEQRPHERVSPCEDGGPSQHPPASALLGASPGLEIQQTTHALARSLRQESRSDLGYAANAECASAMQN